MARSKIHTTTTPDPTTYHLAERLKGLAIDSLYRFTEGHRTLAPIDGHTVTALHTTHPWGYSAQLHATDSHGNLHAAAEAAAIHPCPRPSAHESEPSAAGHWHGTTLPPASPTTGAPTPTTPPCSLPLVTITMS